MTKGRKLYIIYMNNSSYENMSEFHAGDTSDSKERRVACLEKEREAPKCEYMHVHEDIVERVNQVMPGEEELFDLAELFKIFGDSTRVRILFLLFESEMCVCDIAQLLGMTQSAISHQLQVLKKSKLVKYRREGKTVFYSLADSHVRTILDQGMEHIEE